MFQSQLDRDALAFPDFRKGVESGRIGLVVADVTDLRRPAVAWYNPEKMFYAASLPKVAAVFTALIDVQEGHLALDEDLRNHMVGAVQRSSNQSASALIDQVGIEHIAEVLQDDAHGKLYDPEHDGGLWLGRAYDGRPAWKGDPIHGISHGASAMAVARLYYGILTGRLLDPEYLPLFEEIFGDPKLRHKFVKGLEGRDVRIYRKSGTWRQYHADSGIVERDSSRYIVVAIDETDHRPDKIVREIRLIDDLMLRRHPPE